MTSSTVGGSDPEDQIRYLDAVADKALIDAYHRLPLDPEFIQSAACLVALTIPEW